MCECRNVLTGEACQDSSALDEIQKLLSAFEWTAGTIEQVAEVVAQTGRVILDVDMEVPSE